MSDDFREGENVGSAEHYQSGGDYEAFQKFAGTRTPLLDPKDLHRFYTFSQLQEAIQTLRNEALAKLTENEKAALGIKDTK